MKNTDWIRWNNLLLSKENITIIVASLYEPEPEEQSPELEEIYDLGEMYDLKAGTGKSPKYQVVVYLVNDKILEFVLEKRDYETLCLAFRRAGIDMPSCEEIARFENDGELIMLEDYSYYEEGNC